LTKFQVLVNALRALIRLSLVVKRDSSAQALTLIDFLFSDCAFFQFL